MSLATRHMTDTVTVWTKSGYNPSNPYEDQLFSPPSQVKCEYLTGGRMQRDAEGVQFQPSTTIYSVESIPFGAYVVFGVSKLPGPPKNAEIVRKTGFGTELRGQTTEYEAFTG